MVSEVTLTPDGDVLVPPATAARILGGISARTLANWRVEGIGPPFVKVGRRVFYRLEHLQAWVAAATRTSTSDRPLPSSR